MMSNFVKKLLFARKFYMNEGKFEILSNERILLSPKIIHILMHQDYDPNTVKQAICEEFHEVSNNLGLSRKEMLPVIEDVFNIYGLGKLEVIGMDPENKTATLSIYNSTIAKVHNAETSQHGCLLNEAVLAGLFSYVFKNNSECRENKCFAKGDEYCTYEITEEN